MPQMPISMLSGCGALQVFPASLESRYSEMEASPRWSPAWLAWANIRVPSSSATMPPQTVLGTITCSKTPSGSGLTGGRVVVESLMATSLCYCCGAPASGRAT